MLYGLQDQAYATHSFDHFEIIIGAKERALREEPRLVRIRQLGGRAVALDKQVEVPDIGIVPGPPGIIVPARILYDRIAAGFRRETFPEIREAAPAGYAAVGIVRVELITVQRREIELSVVEVAQYGDHQRRIGKGYVGGYHLYRRYVQKIAVLLAPGCSRQRTQHR